MRETMIRRLLVLVLCASGIVALWILADRSLTTPETARSGQSETGSPSARRAASPIGSTAAEPGVSRRISARPAPTGPAAAGPSAWPASRRQPPTQRYPGPDGRPPAVTGLRVIHDDHDSITVRWNAVRYVRRIAYYHVTLNGIPVGDTAGLQLTIDWFNDDMTSHFVLVRAVDVDGERGRPGNPLLVNRPAAASAEPSPGQTSTPKPSHAGH